MTRRRDYQGTSQVADARLHTVHVEKLWQHVFLYSALWLAPCSDPADPCLCTAICLR